MVGLKVKSKIGEVICILGLLSSINSWANVPKVDTVDLLKSNLADSIKADSGVLRIRGTILLSNDEKYVFVQSGNSFLKIRRDLIKGKDIATLDRPGSRVSMSIPQQAIEYSWSISAQTK